MQASLSTGPILSGIKSIVLRMSLMGLLDVAAAIGWRLVSGHWFKHYFFWPCLILLMISAKGHEVRLPGWWQEALPRMPQFCNHGQQRVPATFPWYTGILWRPKHESHSANSTAFGREASPQRSHGMGKKCELFDGNSSLSLSLSTARVCEEQGHTLLIHFVWVSRGIIIYLKPEDYASLKSRLSAL